MTSSFHLEGQSECPWHPSGFLGTLGEKLRKMVSCCFEIGGEGRGVYGKFGLFSSRSLPPT